MGNLSPADAIKCVKLTRVANGFDKRQSFEDAFVQIKLCEHWLPEGVLNLLVDRDINKWIAKVAKPGYVPDEKDRIIIQHLQGQN